MENSYEEMLEAVKGFVVRKVGRPNNGLSEDSIIEDDFGMAGLDTMIFYDDFFTEFKITNPADFKLEEYVTSENLQLGLLFKSIFSKAAKENLKVKTTTIKHLTLVALERKWKEPE